MNITVMGAGYVGLVTAACFAELGNQVTCVDVDRTKTENLAKGNIPLYEPGLDTLIQSGLAEKRLHFVTALEEQPVRPQVIFIAVGTPEHTDGSADMRYVLDAATVIGNVVSAYCVVVDKSTVPVGVADQVTALIQAGLDKRGVSVPFDVVSNPEFLREGAAINDFMQPDRIVVGLSSPRARSIMQELYMPILQQPEKLYFMTVRDAEMTKYGANAMLAGRISFMNELALLCEPMGVDIEKVKQGMGTDVRIGMRFLNAGCGYGGSCFPKDVRALIHMAETHGVDPLVLRAIEKRNFLQKQVLGQKIAHRFGRDLSGVRIGVWGLSFKPDTDDMREAPSVILLEQLTAAGAVVYAYDPAAMPKARKILPATWFESGQLVLAAHQYEALAGADALVLVTEWKPFCYPDLSAMAGLMRQKIVFDGRNQYDPRQLSDAGFEYVGMGRARGAWLEGSSSPEADFLQTLTYQ